MHHQRSKLLLSGVQSSGIGHTRRYCRHATSKSLKTLGRQQRLAGRVDDQRARHGKPRAGSHLLVCVVCRRFLRRCFWRALAFFLARCIADADTRAAWSSRSQVDKWQGLALHHRWVGLSLDFFTPLPLQREKPVFPEVLRSSCFGISLSRVAAAAAASTRFARFQQPF